MVGIVDLDVAFPRSRVHVKQMHESCGLPMADILAWTHCEQIPVFGESEPAWELISATARGVLARTGVSADDVGQVIVAGSGEWDHPAWSPAARIADDLGVTRAQCFEVVNFCNAVTVATQIAAEAIGSGRVRHSLVLLGERLSRSVDYSDPESVALFNTGDAAAALLLGRHDPVFKLVHTQTRTDPGWSDYYVGEYDVERVVVRRRERRLNLPQTYLRNYRALIAETLSALDRSVSDVRYLLVNHLDRRVHERLLHTLDIPFERSVFNYDRLGHMGGGDTVVALADLHAERRLRSGDLVLLATSGTGFSWGVTALEYR